MKRILVQLRRLTGLVLEHDVLSLAKAAAFSGMLMLFPAVMAMTSLLALAPEGSTLMGEIRYSFDRVFPADTMDLLQLSLQSRKLHSAQVIFLAVALSVYAGLGVMLSLMEGFRRAYGQRRDAWSFWERRGRALLLVPIVLAPLALATLLLVFGRPIEHWMVGQAGHELRRVVLFTWRMERWAVAVAASIAVMGATYHFGTKRMEHWSRVLPGAVSATALWFPVTLLFGWYVARLADYSRFYGSFGAGIATLVWLFLTAFSVLLGAEVNGLLYARREINGGIASGASMADSDHSGL